MTEIKPYHTNFLRRRKMEEHRMKTRIHVNQHKIRSNTDKPKEEREPTLTLKTYKGTTVANEVEILGPSKVVYSPDKPLSCGAKVWIETESEVVTK